MWYSTFTQVLFVTVSDFHKIRSSFRLPADLHKFADAKGKIENDSLTFAIVRWFQPHETVIERDESHRPVCPGPLRINHCLWKYAVTPTPRRILVNPDGSKTRGFLSQKQLFGTSPSEQHERFQSEKRAYFGLVSPCSVLHTSNMCPIFKYNTSEFDESVWLETVTSV